MEKTYKSKIGIELVIVLSISLGASAILFIAEGIWLGLLLIVIVVVFIINLFTTTDYTIKGENLYVRSGIFFKKTISIQSIRKIEESGSILSGPALSLDRLEIFYNKFDSVLVSPKNKDEFIAHLTRINSLIDVKLHIKKSG